MDELCDAVMMGVVQLQAAFSVLAPRFAILGSRDGGTLSKGWIRCTGVRRVLPSLRVVRVRHHQRSSGTIQIDALTSTTRCDTSTVLVQL